MKEKHSGCGLFGAWATMTLIVGFFLVPLGLVLGFFIAPPMMVTFGGGALLLAVVIGLFLALYYRKREATDLSGSQKDKDLV